MQSLSIGETWCQYPPLLKLTPATTFSAVNTVYTISNSLYCILSCTTTSQAYNNASLLLFRKNPYHKQCGLALQTQTGLVKFSVFLRFYQFVLFHFFSFLRIDLLIHIFSFLKIDLLFYVVSSKALDNKLQDCRELATNKCNQT